MPSSIRPPFARTISPLLLATTLCASVAAPVLAAEGGPETPAIVEVESVLPPALPWDGASRSLAVEPDSEDPWITPSERSGLRASPDYGTTMAWLRRLVVSTADLHMVSLGKSGEGRDIWMVIASSSQAFSPEKVRASRKPVVLAQAGIHSGEIDGKDAGLMLLRDMTVRGTKRHLLDHVEWLFVPILNVDGHERRSAHGRINQRGPEVMGWRTTARNLNLNRDFAKADSPEMQALLRALGTWEPDLLVDLHVTDGIDYQYDITWGYGGPQSTSPTISTWLETVLDPPVQKKLEAMGHVPGYLVFGLDGQNPDNALFHWSAADPRFSDGYGAWRHLPTILVENHSLDPYDRRVLGTYVLLEGILETVGREAASLHAATATDRARRPKSVATSWTVDRQAPPERVAFAGVAWKHEDSEISGRQKVVWLGTPEQKQLPRFLPTVPVGEVELPEAYWVPAPWTEVIERLALHGVRYEMVEE
ncbi:MAG: M14 family metallopeptidase, partial [Holophagales bacterium]|nr:M14 family metallopeptidase [Holophagales bacterium]